MNKKIAKITLVALWVVLPSILIFAIYQGNRKVIITASLSFIWFILVSRPLLLEDIKNNKP